MRYVTAQQNTLATLKKAKRERRRDGVAISHLPYKPYVYLYERDAIFSVALWCCVACLRGSPLRAVEQHYIM